MAVAPRQLHWSGALGKTPVTMAFITGADQEDKLLNSMLSGNGPSRNKYNRYNKLISVNPE